MAILLAVWFWVSSAGARNYRRGLDEVFHKGITVYAQPVFTLVARG